MNQQIMPLGLRRFILVTTSLGGAMPAYALSTSNQMGIFWFCAAVAGLTVLYTLVGWQYKVCWETLYCAFLFGVYFSIGGIIMALRNTTPIVGLLLLLLFLIVLNFVAAEFVFGESIKRVFRQKGWPF